MKYLFKLLAKSLLTLALLFAITPTPVNSLAKFDTTYQVNYSIFPSGVTHVRYEVNQKNKLSVVYATEFSLSINHTKISNVRVVDEGAPLIPEITKTRNGSIITFSFINRVVGKDKAHKFIIEYDTEDVASKNGNTWEINIPRLEADENTTDHSVILNLPPSFPKPAFIDPKPTTTINNSFLFSGPSLGNKSISAVFGLEQFFKVDLSYHLVNESSLSQEKIIAIPPDTNYQKVSIESITPMPEKIMADSDGNWLAYYSLKPNASLDPEISLLVKVNFMPSQKNINNSSELVTQNEIWDYENPIFTMPDIENLKSPRQIYDFVVDKFSYDFNKASNLKSSKIPASESLKTPQSAVCTDFTNVFIAISRKLGIPARELQGYALSANQDLKPLSLKQDILHAWPEYYDSQKNTWIQIDPTWAKTTQGVDYFNKLDFNHIVFVIHGNNPYEPITAGGYKTSTKNTKDVRVEATNAKTFPEPELTIESANSRGDELILDIKNNSKVSFFGDISVGKSEMFNGYSGKISVIPYSTTNLSIPLNSASLIKTKTINTIISINGKTINQPITISAKIPPFFLFSGAGFILGSIAFFAWSISIRRR